MSDGVELPRNSLRSAENSPSVNLPLISVPSGERIPSNPNPNTFDSKPILPFAKVMGSRFQPLPVSGLMIAPVYAPSWERATYKILRAFPCPDMSAPCQVPSMLLAGAWAKADGRTSVITSQQGTSS
jgi:hypothetical protein